MNPLNPLFCVAVLLISFLTGYLIQRKSKLNLGEGRYETIDGMRGFLALSVFVHHAAIWYKYLHTGIWGGVASNLYTQLGQTGVSFFFMITSFLFVSKLIHSQDKEFNWKHFFVSRLFRLVPMYFFSVALIVIIVLFITHWQLQVDFGPFVESIVHWCLFTIDKMPDINGYNSTAIINAGVVWSLPYEWLFYFCLPLIALVILKNKPQKIYLGLSVLFILAFFPLHEGRGMHALSSFVGGAIAPFLLKYTPWNQKAKSIYVSILILLCLFLIGQFEDVYNAYCLILSTIVFTSIALGNSLFGLLKNTTLKFLGEISYSTYLMHGIIMFIVFYFGFGLEQMKTFTPLHYWLIIFTIAPLLVIVSFLGFKYIEKPNMDRAKKRQ
ncbi:MAG TPA: acyltransferase [Cytophagaceae bacterium]|nr:acyltransferase [Cytophagaceae bacterium]